MLAVGSFTTLIRSATFRCTPFPLHYFASFISPTSAPHSKSGSFTTLHNPHAIFHYATPATCHYTNATLQGLQFLQSSAQAISSRMLLHSIPNPIVPFRSIATLAFSHRTFFSGMLYLPLRSVYPIGIVPSFNIPFQYLRFLLLSK